MVSGNGQTSNDQGFASCFFQSMTSFRAVQFSRLVISGPPSRSSPRQAHSLVYGDIHCFMHAPCLLPTRSYFPSYVSFTKWNPSGILLGHPCAWGILVWHPCVASCHTCWAQSRPVASLSSHRPACFPVDDNTFSPERSPDHLLRIGRQL